MSFSEKLNNLNLDQDSLVKLKFSDGRQVFHYTGDYYDKVLKETNAVGELAYVISNDEIRKSNSIIESMECGGLLWDFNEEEHNFKDYVEDVIRKDWQSYIQESLEQWDHKRGMSNLSVEFEVPLYLLSAAENSGLLLTDSWSAYIETDSGVLEVKP